MIEKVTLSSDPNVKGLRIDPITSKIYINNIIITNQINRLYNFENIKNNIESFYNIKTIVEIEQIFEKTYDFEYIDNLDYFKVDWVYLLSNVSKIIFETSTNNIKFIFNEEFEMIIWKLKNV